MKIIYNHENGRDVSHDRSFEVVLNILSNNLKLCALCAEKPLSKTHKKHKSKAFTVHAIKAYRGSEA